MAHSWTYDAPSGVYKNHAISSDLRVAAIAQAKFMQSVRPEPGYGRKKGESITISRVSNMAVPSDDELTEGVDIPEDEFSLSTKAITVKELGRAVPYNNLAEDLSEFNIANSIQRALRDQMKLSLDKRAAGSYKTAQVKFIPTSSTGGVFDTDGTASTVALSNLSVKHVEQIRDYMFTTLNIPALENDDYMCYASTKALRGLKSDPDWETWHKYTDPAAKYNGEVGRLENIRFVEINHTLALSGSLGSGGVLGEAVFFGDDSCSMAVALDPELRAEIPQGHGRRKSVAWYAILNFGIVWDTANAGEARIVHLTSA
jgi:N4-gp56 family major capsid protein